MSDLREAYGKGYDDGARAVLRMLNTILDDSPTSGYSELTNYYKHGIEIILEAYNYGKEEKEN